MYDVGIIGAGPAGATLARLLAGRYRVLLLNNGRQKCCGGILTPESMEVLAALDLPLPKSVLANPQPYNVAVLDFDNQLTRRYVRKYVNVHRQSFDDWLRSLVPAGADVSHNAKYIKSKITNKQETTFPTPIEIHFMQDSIEHTEKVRYLIGADGAFSSVRREFFFNAPMPQRYIAVQEWYEISNLTGGESINLLNNYTGVFSSKLTDFYAWTIPKDEYLILGIAVPIQKTGSTAKHLFGVLKSQFAERFGVQLGEARKQETSQLLRPRHYRDFCLGGVENVFLIGEAAGLISPSSAEGISSALTSAKCLAEAFLTCDIGQPIKIRNKYQRRILPLLYRLYLKNLKCPAMFCPAIRRWIMKTGLCALKD